MKRVKSIMLDRPVSAMDVALHLTEQAIRQKRTIFKPAPVKWIDYLYFEQLALLLTAILLIK
jgi:hypothetical protein